MSSSVSNISFRYHPDDEELDDSYDTYSSISTSSIKSEATSEESSATGSSADVPSSVLGRLGIREETDKWKLFREVKGRITKSVEEKIEEIKTERMKKDCKQRRSVLDQTRENSSMSDEEPSESSQVSATDMPTNSVKSDKTEENHESDPSFSQGSSPDRSTTPVPLPTPDNAIEEEVDRSQKKGKGLKNAVKRKKGKTKGENVSAAGFDKTTILYSALSDNDTDSLETVEIAQEVMETSPEDSRLARELDKLAHPSLFWQAVHFVTEWHVVVLPVTAVLLHYTFNLPQYVEGFLMGVTGLLVLQWFFSLAGEVLGTSEAPIKQLKDLLPLTGVPIFRRSISESDLIETSCEGWMNEYTKDYHPETYHITLTDTVYVKLDGTRLKLSSPRSKIPKRALWNEPRYRLLFSKERLYDIANCRVELRPHGLIHRRCWSKKYPICIILNPNSKLGVRIKEKGQDTVDEDAPWFEEDKYNFDTLSEDSDDDNADTGSSRRSEIIGGVEEDYSKQSLVPEDVEFHPGSEAVESEDFVKVTVAPQQESRLFLFARTDREKDVWFRRLTTAVREQSSVSKQGLGPSLIKAFKISDGSTKHKDSHPGYLPFMMQLSLRTTATLPDTKESSSKQSEKVNTADLKISTDMMWINAFLGRIIYDIAQDPDKLVKIQAKIQKKLSTIKLPMFLEQLVVSSLDLGSAVPVLQRASRPVLNAQGIWVDLDIVYEGGFKMTIDTKLNMDRIKQAQADSPTSDSPKNESPAKTLTPTTSPQPESTRRSAVYNSEVEDSAETSSEEPDTARLHDPTLAGQAGSIAQPKYVRFLDKVAQSKYFQQVVDYKFVKKFVHNNNLQLLVEVKGLLGTLALNIPPPPCDRIWYGFRTNPKLWLSAQPKFGQHAVAVISRIIEKKLSLEFQRVLVLPNMDDMLIKVMSHDIPS